MGYQNQNNNEQTQLRGASKYFNTHFDEEPAEPEKADHSNEETLQSQAKIKLELYDAAESTEKLQNLQDEKSAIGISDT
jgi:hypothetical protein